MPTNRKLKTQVSTQVQQNTNKAKHKPNVSKDLNNKDRNTNCKDPKSEESDHIESKY